MSFAGFFDYPSSEGPSDPSALIFLPTWDEGQWSALFKYTTTSRFEQGDMVIHLGDTDQTLFLIIDGKLEILIQDKRGRMRATATREAGSIIGEQSFLEGKPRSASIRALTRCELLAISIDAYEQMSARDPAMARDVLFDLARILSVKLRQANQLLSKVIK